MFYKIGVLKNFTEFTWKQLRSVTLIKKTPVQVLSCEFCEIFKNPFWQNTSGRLLLDFFHSLNCFLPPSELIETRFFLFLNMFYHGFRTWWISRTLLLETDDLVEVAGKQTFLETPGVKRCFFRLINLLTFISICLLNFCTPLSCNSLLEIQRSSYQCDSLIQRCSLKKLFLNILQY